MAQQRLVKVDEIESVTHDFLWRASNEILQKTPTISQHLANALVSSVPEDGMSAFAKRMHCTGCGGLMLTAKVRLRKTKKRYRDRNRVLRTCLACEKVNKNAGVPRGVQVKAGDECDVEELRREAAKNKRRESKGKGLENGLSIAKTPVGKKSNKKKKRKRSKSLDGATSKPDGKRSGLAASFLFEPL